MARLRPWISDTRSLLSRNKPPQKQYRVVKQILLDPLKCCWEWQSEVAGKRLMPVSRTTQLQQPLHSTAVHVLHRDLCIYMERKAAVAADVITLAIPLHEVEVPWRRRGGCRQEEEEEEEEAANSLIPSFVMTRPLSIRAHHSFSVR